MSLRFLLLIHRSVGLQAFTVTFPSHFFRSGLLAVIFVFLTNILYGQTDTVESNRLLRQSSRPVEMMARGSSVMNLSGTAPQISYGASRNLGLNENLSWHPSNTGGTAEFQINILQTLSSGFYNPLNTVVKPDGTLYVANAGYHSILQRTVGGTLSTFAGGGGSGLVNGTGSAARFKHPSFVAFDASGNLYVADQQNHVIRKITPSGTVSTFAGSGSIGSANGTGTSASFQYPMGLAFDGAGNLFVADAFNNLIRKITPSGVVSTYAGSGTAGLLDGPLLNAQFKQPMALHFDGNGDLYITDRLNYAVRRIRNGSVTTVAGGTSGNVDGTGSAARFSSNNLSVSDGNIYLVDQTYSAIKYISPSGTVKTISTSGQFTNPFGISRSIDGSFYVTENSMDRIKQVNILPAYSISPALPVGFTFDRNTGEIKGSSATAIVSATYTVTARNGMGSTTATVTFGVGGSGPIAGFQGSSDQNYIIETTARRPLTSSAAINTASIADVNRTIRYFDGLGRPIQSVQWQASPTNKDIVQPIAYDGFGRESRKYLPYAENLSGDGAYKSLAGTNQQTYYSTTGSWDSHVAKTGKPYAETVFESSPLNRVKEQGAPGEAWQPATSRGTTGRTVVTDYGTNVADDVRMWEVENGGANYTAYYAAGKLYRTIIKDENWKSGQAGTVEEYKDFEGRVVLKRVWNINPDTDQEYALNTYYVYDDFGDLCYIIPPLFVGSSFTNGITDVEFDNYIYAYKYDDKRRLAEKKIPGKGWVYLVYNDNDEVVLIQNAVQRTKHPQEWSYIKYDAFSRITETGIYTNSYTDQNAAQLAVTGHVTATGNRWEERTIDVDPISPTGFTRYTNVSFPIDNLKPLVVNYYDDHKFEGANTVGLGATVPEYFGNSKTLLTGMMVYKDDGTSPLLTINYYDKRARLIESVSKNHLNGTDRITNTYSFLDELETSKREHIAKGNTTHIHLKNTYDHVGRLLDTKHKVNGQNEVTLAKNEYNEIGQLSGKHLHYSAASTVAATEQLDGNDIILSGATREVVASSSILLKSGFHAQEGSTFKASIAEGASMQHIQYAYNERGWLKSQNSEDFGFELKYEKGTAPQYNGNISEQQWHRGSIPESKTFFYSYDPLNRLKDGNSADGNMREQIRYDDMGNITNLKRDGQVGTSYTYTGNRLKRLTGTINMTTDYTYDLNGNAERDYTGMNFRYNHLNLPDTAWNSSVRVGYLYDALGKKLRKYSNQGGNRDYVDGIEYKADGTIDLIHTGEGLAVRNESNNTYSYRYNITDHLGNVRAAIYRNPTTNAVEPLQKDDYYPFGKQHVVLGDNNKYLYNGKEKQEELNEQYDYGARFYDAEIGRWNVVDPLADEFENVSPYNYGMNNPILMVDPTGMKADTAKITWFSQIAQVTVSAMANMSDFARLWEIHKTADMYSRRSNGSKDHAGYAGMTLYLDKATGGMGDLIGARSVGGTSSLSKIFSNRTVTKSLITNKLKNVSTTGKLLGRISNGKVVMNGRTHKDGTFDFVVTKDGELLLGRKHTFLSGGDDVLAAGEIKIRGGQVVGLNNASGHYMPTFSESGSFLNTLKEIGVDVSKTHFTILNESGRMIRHIKP